MLLTVVLDRDLRVLPAHVEIRDRITELVAYGDLRLRSRQARLNQDDAQPRLLRRLRAGVEELDRLTGSRDPSASGVSARQQLYIGSVDVDRARQRVDPGNCGHRRVPAAEVERCPCRRGDRYSNHQLHLAFLDPVSVCLNARWRSPVLVQHVDDVRIIGPPAAVQGGGGEARNNASSSRPQPRRFRADLGIHHGVARNVDVRKKPPVTSGQGGLIQVA